MTGADGGGSGSYHGCWRRVSVRRSARRDAGSTAESLQSERTQAAKMQCRAEDRGWVRMLGVEAAVAVAVADKQASASKVDALPRRLA